MSVTNLDKKSKEFEKFMKDTRSTRGMKKLDGKVSSLEKNIAKVQEDSSRTHDEVNQQLEQQGQRLDEYEGKQKEMRDSLQRCEDSVKEYAHQQQGVEAIARSLKAKLREEIMDFFSQAREASAASGEKKFEARIAKLEVDSKETSEILRYIGGEEEEAPGEA